MYKRQYGRSVPAPGQGILSTARETKGSARNPSTVKSRWRRYEHARKGVMADNQYQLQNATTVEERLAIQEDTQRTLAHMRYNFGQCFWKGNPRISPLRGALSVFGLSIDDVSCVSFQYVIFVYLVTFHLLTI